MALKTITGKSGKSDLEKDVLIAMINAEVTQVDIAEYENVTQPAINNRLKRLTPDKARAFKQLIKDVAEWKRNRTIQKATG